MAAFAAAQAGARMTALCMMKLLCQATRNENRYAKRFFGTLLSQTPQKKVYSTFWVVTPDPRKLSVFRLTHAFYTTETSQKEPKTVFASVGRRIPDKILNLLNQDGESLGNMHRIKALKIMDESQLKLVLVDKNVNPPVYRLMSGKQISEERIKYLEKQKAATKSEVIWKEIAFSAAIGKNDFETKTTRIAQWIEKKYHVKVTVRQVEHSNTDVLLIFDKILEAVSDKATYLSKPKVLKKGVSVCVLRHKSNKELKQHLEMVKEKTSTEKTDEDEVK